MAHYVLIHGAAYGGWCWEKVIKNLKRKGHVAIAPDLPGHERNSPLSVSEITFDRYVEKIVNLINEIDVEVILVGHSLGGAVVEATIDRIAHGKILKAFFVSGLIPRDGDTLGEILDADTESQLKECFSLNENGTAIILILEKMEDIIYNGCSSEDILNAKSKIVPQAVQPFVKPIRIQNRKTVQRIGIVCNYDKSLTPQNQDSIYRSAGCKLKYLNCGHAPFFSHADELSEILIDS